MLINNPDEGRVDHRWMLSGRCKTSFERRKGKFVDICYILRAVGWNMLLLKWYFRPVALCINEPSSERGAFEATLHWWVSVCRLPAVFMRLILCGRSGVLHTRSQNTRPRDITVLSVFKCLFTKQPRCKARMKWQERTTQDADYRNSTAWDTCNSVVAARCFHSKLNAYLYMFRDEKFPVFSGIPVFILSQGPFLWIT